MCGADIVGAKLGVPEMPRYELIMTIIEASPPATMLIDLFVHCL